jgi:hypothetical protein
VAVAVDLVPHDIARALSLAAVHQLTEDANILIAELKTIRQLLALPTEQRTFELEDAVASIPNIRKEFPGRWLLLRFGIGNIDQSLVISPTGEARYTYTGYQELTDATGFGDELTARELHILLSKGIEGWSGEKIEVS